MKKNDSHVLKMNAAEQTGFTLIELLIVIAMTAILLTLAVPSFVDMQKSNAVRSHQYEYLSAFNFARGEAVSRSTVVSLCASPAPRAAVPSCGVAADWASGWIIFVDNGLGGGNYGDGVRNGNETLLRAYDYQGSNLTRVVDATSTGTALASISWDHTGALLQTGTGANRVTAMVCERNETPVYNRAISVGLSGRSMLSSDVNGTDGIHDGVYEADDGTVTFVTLNCTP